METRKEQKRERKRKMRLLSEYNKLYKVLIDDAMIGKAEYLINTNRDGETLSVYRNSAAFYSIPMPTFSWDNKKTKGGAAEAREAIRANFLMRGLQPWHLDEMEKYRD